MSGIVPFLLLMCTPAHAQDPDASEDRARELYENGAILYNEGRYDDAVLAWQESYRLSERFELLYNIANAQERLGMWDEALETLNRYRAYAPAEERDTLDRRIANLERRIAELPAEEVPAAAPVAVEPAEVVLAEEAPGEEGRSWMLPATTLGLGVVGLSSGTFFALQAGAAREAVAASCVDGLCLQDAQAPLQRDLVSSLIADGSFLIGGIGLISSVLVIALNTDAQLGISPRGLTLSGAF